MTPEIDGRHNAGEHLLPDGEVVEKSWSRYATTSSNETVERTWSLSSIGSVDSEDILRLWYSWTGSPRRLDELFISEVGCSKQG